MINMQFDIRCAPATVATPEFISFKNFEPKFTADWSIELSR